MTPNATNATLSLFELHFLLKARGLTLAEQAETKAIYDEVFADPDPVDEEVVRQAIVVRERSGGRLPVADALIAGCALKRNAVLVCKDARFLHVPGRLVKQIRLPEGRTSADVG